MTLYGPITRAAGVIAGPLGVAPYAVANWSDEDLRDLDRVDPSFGLSGLAYWPVTLTDPAYDPATETLTDEVSDLVAHPETFSVSGVRGKRSLTPEELAIRNPVPAEVSNVQGHAVLIMYGLQDAAQAAITALPEGIDKTLAQLAFDRASFVRSSPLINQLSASLGLSDEQLDTMFRTASTIVI